MSVILEDDRMEKTFGLWRKTEMGQWALENGLELKISGYTDASTMMMKIHVYAEIDHETHQEYKELTNLAIITDNQLIPEYYVS